MKLVDAKTGTPAQPDDILTGRDQRTFKLVRWDDEFVYVREKGERSLDRYRAHFFSLRLEPE